MPLLPISACMGSFIGGKELKQGMKTLCICIVILCMLAILFMVILCSALSREDDKKDPVSFPATLALILSIIILIVLHIEKIPPIAHFILIVMWVIVTIYVVFAALYMLSRYSNRGVFDGACGFGLFLSFIDFIFITACMVYGVFVYWSYYAEMDD